MTLKFEINNNIIRKGHSDYIPNDDSGDLFASFVFNTKDWKHLEKYAIFWNRKGKSTIRYITDKSHGSCPVPHMALDDLYFYVQVYANDDMFTQKLKVYNYDCPTDIREAIANAGGAIKDEDLYLKAGFYTNGIENTINTTKKSFLLTPEHNNIIETIYLNEPISGKNMNTERDIENLYEGTDDGMFFFESEEELNDFSNQSFSTLGFEEGSIDILFYSYGEPQE